VNATWPEATYPFLDPYLDVLALNYGAGLYPMDFVGAPEESRVTINAWVAQETNRKILDLLPQGSITPLTCLVLTNAVYFDAAWEDTFKLEYTYDQPFHLLDGGTKQTPTMHREGSYRLATGAGWQALELAYDGGEMSMVIVLPDSGMFAEFEQQVSAQTMASVCAGLTLTQGIVVAIPKFSYEYGSVSLVDALQRMGVTHAFEGGVADFSVMDGTRILYISDVLHKAFVAVDEKGTTAAAATAVVIDGRGVPLETFVADRPFIYFIRDNLTGQVVVIGRVVDPTL
jgi:serpin B